MHIRIDNQEIFDAVAALIVAQIPGATVVAIEFTRQKGGKVYADATIELR